MKSFTCGSSTSSTTTFMNSFRAEAPPSLPHQGALYRIVDQDALTSIYVIGIRLENGQSHELKFTPQQFDFCQKLFAILDTESRGAVDRAAVQEFVTLRCPVFCRRDEDLRDCCHSDSPTFDEVWASVVETRSDRELGVEGWMVFCRFIALAQYLEAKRRFSARHLQQTMRHRNSPRGSEVVVVDVPPPEPPAPLSRQQLAQYERKTNSQAPLPLPELDLDHSLLAAHDWARRRACSSPRGPPGVVKISLFGSHHHHDYSSPNEVEFKVSYLKNADCQETDAPVVVRRSMEDMKWLNDTFKAHKVLGGTLCGRILPPFPGSNGKILASQFQRDDTLLNSSIQKTTGGAIAAAAAGVEIIKDVAKSFWKDSKKSCGGKPKKSSKPNKASPSLSLALPESYYNPNSPAGKARQVERYLNYLLEHPALSTSFPLNTILKASQSGLEAAKQSLEACGRVSKEVKEQTPQLTDGKSSVPFWGSTIQSVQPSLSWVRTAAQAAMALKVHGILETTGMQAASAMLQHASLPNFEGAKNNDWVDEEQQQEEEQAAPRLSASDRASSFEQGVVSVQSELQAEVRPPNDDDGYDLLPLPIPAPERRILSAGSRPTKTAHLSSLPGGGQAGSVDSQKTRFHYGTSTLQRRLPMDEDDDGRTTFLGDISEMIGSLREVIGSVDNTLSRCLASSGGIGRARREQGALHLSIVQGFDSWIGLRGKFIGQRALLKGVAGIEQSNEVYEESDLALIDDVSWQASLANSAVSAAEDVRSAVRAAKTAENAKAAASAAAFAAQSACDAGGFPTIDEARASQTRASIAQSHAFHAAVVDHEAKGVKRRATLALAHDVMCWNVHRKREMLLACLAHARSQHEATRRAVDAWSCLRDGYIGSSAIPSAQTRKGPPPVHATSPRSMGRATVSTMKDSRAALAFAPSVTSFGHVSPPRANVDIFSAEAFADIMNSSSTSMTSYYNQSSSRLSSRSGVHTSGEFCAGSSDSFGYIISPSEVPSGSRQHESEHEEPTATIYQDIGNVIIAVDHHVLSNIEPPPLAKSSENSFDKNDSSEIDFFPFAETVLPLVTAAPVTEEDGKQKDPPKPTEEKEVMSASMQSLVDGLMTWGDQFEADDVLALPHGLGASFALEENNLTSHSSPF